VRAHRPRRLVAAVLAGVVGVAWLSVVSPAPRAAAATFDPGWVARGPGYHRASPTVADLNGDGNKEVVVGDYSGVLRAFRSDGSVMWETNLGGPIDDSAAIGDINGDGHPDVVVGVGSGPGGGNFVGMVALDRAGNIMWKFALPQPGVLSSPALGDVDGSGRPQVVFGALNHLIYALHGDGSVVSGFPFDNTDTVQSTPALFNSDGDGRMEVIIGGDASSPAPGIGFPGGFFRVLDWNGGHVNVVHEQHFTDIVRSAIAVGNLQGDGRMVAVFATGGFPAYDGTVDATRVYAVHLDDGSNAAGWPKTTAAVVSGSAGLADLEGNGRLDVVIGDQGGNVYAWRGDGSQLWSLHPGAPGSRFFGGVAIGDMSGNGRQDVAIGYGFGGALVLRGADGVTIGHPNALTADGRGAAYASESTPAIADFGASGRRLIVPGWDPGLSGFSSGALAAYVLPATSVADAWPMLGRTASHLGAPPSGGNPWPPGICRQPTNPPSQPSSASGKGYWFLGLDGGVFSFDVPFYGSLPGLGLHQQVQAIAATPSGNGYWIVGVDGGVFSFGGARFYGSMGGHALAAPIIRLVPTITGLGYWLLASDGGVFSFGDARFYGSTGNTRLTAPVVGMAATATGHGYWLLASDGGVFSYGDAAFHGSTGGMRLDAPVASIAVPPSGAGYWLLGGDGGVFSFAVPYLGSIPGLGLCHLAAPGVQMRSSATGSGYWVLGSDGGVFSFGDAAFHGSFPGLAGSNRAVDMAIVPR
jgi:hypothetical protein